MNDMSSIIVPRSDQINSDELQNGQTMTITITAVHIRGGQEQPVSMSFAGSDKFYRPCKSMCRVLVQGWGLDANQYVGRSMTLYCDPTVKFGPLAVGGIRISHMSDIDGPMTMALTATKGVKKAYKVLPLDMGAQQQKPDKAADGTRALIARIEEVGSDYRAILAEPEVIKQRLWLEEKRPELAAMVEAAIPKDDPFEGPSDDQRGESHTDHETEAAARATVADIVKQADAATKASEVATQAARLDTHRGSFTEAQIEECEVALSDARGRLN